MTVANPRRIDIGSRSSVASVAELTTLLLVLLITGVAFIYSNLGLGGGLLYVPIMLSLTPHPKEVVVPISLTLVIATGISATLNHHRKGLVDFRLGGLLVGGALAGSAAGVLFNLAIDRRTFIAIFVLVLVLMGGKMLWDWYRGRNALDVDDDSKMTPRRRGIATTGALGSGFTSGSLGIGGGLVNVPLMVYVLGRNTRGAIGTSSLIIVFTAAFGLLAYVLAGVFEDTAAPVNVGLIALLTLFVFVGAYAGSRWGLNHLRTRSVALIFILVIFLAAAKMTVDLL
jgi:uncharacterized membrane protein YfcA